MRELGAAQRLLGALARGEPAHYVVGLPTARCRLGRRIPRVAEDRLRETERLTEPAAAAARAAGGMLRGADERVEEELCVLAVRVQLQRVPRRAHVQPERQLLVLSVETMQRRTLDVSQPVGGLGAGRRRAVNRHPVRVQPEEARLQLAAHEAALLELEKTFLEWRLLGNAGTLVARVDLVEVALVIRVVVVLRCRVGVARVGGHRARSRGCERRVKSRVQSEREQAGVNAVTGAERPGDFIMN